MTAFVWTDRDARRHELGSPARIEAEAAAIAQEMDRYMDILDGGDRMLRDTARTAIRRLQSRLEQLRADLLRWNDHALAAIRAAAATLAEQIERLPATIADVLLVVELHGEQARFRAIAGDSPDMQARMLAEPMTVFNFEVEDFHTYFAGPLAAWAHNDCLPGTGGDPRHAGYRPPQPPPRYVNIMK